LRVSGKDAQDFLQNLITTDVDGLPAEEARPGALLTPQGKILFDFLIWRDGDAFVLETDAEQREPLIRRLTMYKLRAAVDLAPGPEGVTVFWGEDAASGSITDGAFAKAGVALSRSAGNETKGASVLPEDAYHGLRTAAGLPVSGADFALQDAFPHDVLFDKSGGLSFRKGCYVGQEVVSRMQHRGTARRRTVLVRAQGPLPPSGTEITADGKPVGSLGTVLGENGLAIVRIDRVGDALARNVPLLAGGVPVELTLAPWTELNFPTEAQEADH
jgi:folate-binding protein YgfZ